MSVKTDEFDVLAVLAHGNLANKKTLPLPSIHKWTKEFCEALNFLEYTEAIRFELIDPPPHPPHEKIAEVNEFLLDLPNVTCIYVYPDLPVDFTRFAGTMIVKEDQHVKTCLNSMKKGLGLMQGFRQDLEHYSSSAKKATLVELQKLTQMLALSTYFDVNHQNTEEKRGQSKDFDVLNEILQNANDKVKKTGEDDTGKVEVWSSKDYLKLSYLEEDGFLIKDFLAVSSLGNSGNLGRGETTTGHKGTGFKGVYQWFSKVEIRSNGILCVLDDLKQLDYNEIFDGDGIKHADQIPFKDKQFYGEHYPIPIFTEIDMADPKKTELTFFYRKEEGFTKPKNPISTKFFTESKSYYFLSNIDVFVLHETDLNPEKTLNRTQEVENHFYVYAYEILVGEDGTLVDQLLRENLPKRYKKRTLTKEKRTLTFLFPKKIPEKTPEDNLFVDLPVDGCTLFQGNFYINAPLLEITENRRNLVNVDNGWNNQLKIVVCRSVLGSIHHLAQEVLDFAKIAYQYFPFHHLQGDVWQKSGVIKNIKFIHCVQNNQRKEVNSDHLKSISDLEHIHLLPLYMYQAMDQQQKPYEQTIPFIYYPNETNFFSVFSNPNYKVISPQSGTDAEVPFYRWALGEDTWNHFVLTQDLAARLNLETDKNNTGIPLISDFFEEVKDVFGWEFNDPTFNPQTYYNCFEKQRNQLYFKENNRNNPLLDWAKERSTILYGIQNELEALGMEASELNDLIAHNAIEVQGSDGIIRLLTKEMYWTKTDFYKEGTIFSTKDNCACLETVCTSLDKTHHWDSQFFKFLEQYNQQILNQTKKIPAFSFQFPKLSPLSPWILQLCENNIPSETLDSKVTSLVKNLSEETDTIRTVLNKVMIYPHADGSKHRWTYGYLENHDSPYLVLFGERSMAKLMREFFGIEHFSLTRHFTSMECLHPVLQFADWDEFSSPLSANFREKPESQTDDGKNMIKYLLIHHYEHEEHGTFYRFQGYGLEKKCPICQAKLMIEQTQLHLRSVRLAKSEEQDCWTEILCCDNCLGTFPYAEQVYFCPTGEETEDISTFTWKKMTTHLNNSDKLTLCFQLSNGEMRYQQTTITPLHRKWMLDQLPSSDGSS